MIAGVNLADVCMMTLEDCIEWVKKVPGLMPEDMRPMAQSICESFLSTSRRLIDLGLGYLSLDRAASTLSTGERQAHAACQELSEIALRESFMCSTNRQSACIRPI